MPILFKSVLRSALIATALLHISGCASNGFLVPMKTHVVNNSNLSSDEVGKVLKYSGALCKVNTYDRQLFGVGDREMTNMSEPCLAKKFPTCSHWYKPIDMQCVMDITKPLYAVMVAEEDRRKQADAIAKQEEQEKKERARQLQVQYEQSPQGIADKERAVSERNETRLVCNTVINRFAKINMFEVMSGFEFEKIGVSKYRCMGVFRQGYEVYPIVVTYDAPSDRYVANPL